jgi:hypothetical protein
MRTHTSASQKIYLNLEAPVNDSLLIYLHHHHHHHHHHYKNADVHSVNQQIIFKLEADEPPPPPLVRYFSTDVRIGRSIPPTPPSFVVKHFRLTCESVACSPHRSSGIFRLTCESVVFAALLTN